MVRKRLNGLKIYQYAEGFAHLIEEWQEIAVFDRIRDVFIDVDHGGDAAKKVLKEGHHKGGKVREKFELVLGKNGEILGSVEAHHDSVGKVGYGVCRVEKVVVEVAIEVAPLKERKLVEPEI